MPNLNSHSLTSSCDLLALCGLNYSTLVQSITDRQYLNNNMDYHTPRFNPCLQQLIFNSHSVIYTTDARYEYLSNIANSDNEEPTDLESYFRFLLCLYDGIPCPVQYNDFKHAGASEPVIEFKRLLSAEFYYVIRHGCEPALGRCSVDRPFTHNELHSEFTKFFKPHTVCGDRWRLAQLLRLSARNYTYHNSQYFNPDLCPTGPNRRDQVLFIRMLIHLEAAPRDTNMPGYTKKHRIANNIRYAWSMDKTVDVDTHLLGHLAGSGTRIFYTLAKPINPVAYRRLCMGEPVGILNIKVVKTPAEITISDFMATDGNNTQPTL